MKKLIACILCIIYITASSGVVLNVHYCMGKLSSVSVDNFKSDLCRCGMKVSPKGCCHSELKVVKLDNAHKATNHSLQFISSDIVVEPAVVYNYTISYNTACNTAFPNGPPVAAINKIYVRNCVFRI